MVQKMGKWWGQWRAVGDALGEASVGVRRIEQRLEFKAKLGVACAEGNGDQWRRVSERRGEEVDRIEIAGESKR